MIRYLFISSVACLIACSPRRDLPSLFPDAQRALGPFSIHMEKSRDTNILSEAKIRVEQRALDKHVTLKIKMMGNQEQVRLSFLRNMQEDDSDAHCTLSPALADPAQQSSRVTAPLDPSALFHLPLPISIKDAQDLVVQGAGEDWAIRDGNLVWDQTRNPADTIELSWTRNQVPETRYPLQTLEKPLHLTALRVGGDSETEIPVVWRAGYVWVSAQDVEADSWLELRFDVPGTDRNFVLPQEPIAEGTKALVMSPGCRRENFILEKSHLSWNCPISPGPIWAASYTFHQTMGAMDFSDWPELARLDPLSLKAFWDAGEELSIETYGSSRLPRAIPEEARRICIRATWASHLAHEPMTDARR